MHKLYYQYFQPKLLCAFQDWRDAKKARDVLRKRYPESKIWIESNSDAPMLSFEEFMARREGKIWDYERGIINTIKIVE